jgi:hypothetical protein
LLERLAAAALYPSTGFAEETEQMSYALNRESTMQHRREPLIASIAVAILGVMAMLLVDHGPWNVPHLKTAMVNYGNTSAAAKAAGATVTPTEPKRPLEPEEPGPKRAQPVDEVPP